MLIDFLLKKFRDSSDKTAVVWNSKKYSYHELLSLYEESKRTLTQNNVERGTVVSIEGDFSPRSIALFLALIEHGCILVPLTKSVESKIPEFREIAEVELVITLDVKDGSTFQKTGKSAQHALHKKLKLDKHPGLIFFSSGSTGKSKGVVHDVVPLLDKFRVERKSKCLISFLLFDHMGGINTIFYALSNGGCIVNVPDRKPETIAQAIEKHRVQILPSTPTFLNLLLMSEAYKRFDFSSIELISYGTEPMPEGTLKRLHQIFPNIELQQTYGLTELGVMRSKSKSSESLWMKIGGEGFETRVVDGLLEIKAKSAMLGYLNASSPFTDDGWFKTGDAVETDGEYFRILGRKSDIINVGGEKVFPAEIENFLLQMEGVESVVVTGEPNPLMGQIIRATLKLSTQETQEEFKKRLYEYCKGKLPKTKIPQRIVLSKDALYSERFKQIRTF